MNKLYIEIFIKNSNKFDNENDDENTEIFTTLESFIILFIYNYLNCPKNIELKFVQKNTSTTTTTTTDIKDEDLCKYYFRLNSTMIIDRKNENFIKELIDHQHLPMYGKENNFFIFGICSICRSIVLETGEHDNLLGFKKNCLLAPTEKSIWTKLCEIDMISAIKDIIMKFSIDTPYRNDDVIILSEYFTIFENHMSQPTRVHNYYKILRENVRNQFEQKSSVLLETDSNEKNETYHQSSSSSSSTSILLHRYAEGYFLSLVDIILYPFIAFLYLIMDDKVNFVNSFPLIYKWMKNLEEYNKDLNENFHKIMNTEYYRKRLMNCRHLRMNFMRNDDKLKMKNSLYRNDIKTIRLNKEYTNQDKIDECLKKITKLNIKIKSLNIKQEQLKYFDWDNIQLEFVKPEFGNLPKERLERKKHQLKNLINYVIELAKPNDIIVDFCSGTGHLGIILAELLKDCHIIFLENKSISILKLKERIDKLKLTNCSFYQCNIDYFHRKFDIGISLHACGTATDIVLHKCIEVNAKFICCPCCYGSIKPMPHISYPLSKIFKNHINENDYLYIAHAADQSHNANVKNCNLDKREQGEFCMDCIDTDRKLLAEQYDYTVQLKKLYPEDCTPKNRLLIGVKKDL